MNTNTSNHVYYDSFSGDTIHPKKVTIVFGEADIDFNEPDKDLAFINGKKEDVTGVIGNCGRLDYWKLCFNSIVEDGHTVFTFENPEEIDIILTYGLTEYLDKIAYNKYATDRMFFCGIEGGHYISKQFALGIGNELETIVGVQPTADANLNWNIRAILNGSMATDSGAYENLNSLAARLENNELGSFGTKYEKLIRLYLMSRYWMFEYEPSYRYCGIQVSYDVISPRKKLATCEDGKCSNCGTDVLPGEYQEQYFCHKCGSEFVTTA